MKNQPDPVVAFKEKEFAFANNANRGSTTLLALALALLEGVLIFLLHNGRIHLSVFIISHVLVSATVWFWVYLGKKRGDDLRLPFLLAVAATTMNLFGLMGFLLFYLVYLFTARHATPFETWYSSLFPELETSLSQETFERIKRGWDDYSTKQGVVAFKDIFALGTLTQKQEVLGEIAQNFSPRLAPILKLGLEDPSNVIRIESAAIVSKVDALFQEDLYTKKKRVSKKPNSVDALLDLAKHYDEYAFTGLLDPGREEENRHEAVHTYEKVLALDPHHKEALFALARTYVRMGAYKKTIALLEKQQEIDSAMLPWYLEALYQEKAFEKLQQKVALMSETLPESLKKVVHVWER